MLLLRLVVVFLLFYVIFAVLRSLIRRGRTADSSKPGTSPGGEDMVFDPQCQSYIPRSGAVIQSGRYFCSQECARLYINR